MRRYLLLLATLWPLAYAVLFFGNLPSAGPVFYVLVHLGTILWLMGLLAISIVDVFRNPALTERAQIIWAVVLVLGNMLALPVYWLMYLRRGERPGAGAPAGLQNR